MNSPKILVLTGRTGSGKSTVANALCRADPGFAEIASVTTRAPRIGEIYGEDYFFVDDLQFQQMQLNHELFATTKVAGKSYGVRRSEVERLQSVGIAPVLVVDPQGAVDIAEFARLQGWKCAVGHIDCDEKSSLERAADRFILDLQVREGLNQAARQAVVDRHFPRFVRVLGEEGAWDRAHQFDILLPKQQRPHDSEEAVELIRACLGNSALLDNFGEVYRKPLDLKVISAAQSKINDRGARRIYRVLETARALGSPYLSSSELANQISGEARQVEMEHALVQAVSGDDLSTLTDLIDGEGEEGVKAAYSMATDSKLHVLQILACAPFRDCLAALSGRTANLFGMRPEPGKRSIAHDAWQEGNLALVEAIIGAGFDPDTAINSFGQTLLHSAVRASDKEAVTRLIRLGASPDARDEQGESVRDHARRWCVEYLLSSAMVNASPAEQFSIEGMEL